MTDRQMDAQQKWSLYITFSSKEPHKFFLVSSLDSDQIQ